MAGGITQIISYGHQDRYITAHKDDKVRNYISFFKEMTVKYLQFAIESIELDSTTGNTFGNTLKFRIDNRADLMSKSFLQIELPELNVNAENNELVSWVRDIGVAAFDEMVFRIGSREADGKHTAASINLWHELATDSGMEATFNKMVGNIPSLIKPSAHTPSYILYVPLTIFNSLYTCLALPLISLQYTDVEVSIRLKQFRQLINVSSNVSDSTINSLSPNNLNTKLTVDYVFLTDVERLRYVSYGHHYIITEFHTENQSIAGINFNNPFMLAHPTKFIAWQAQLQKYYNGQRFLAYDPTDFAAARDLATRRFILNTAQRCTLDGNDVFVDDDMSADGIALKHGGDLQGGVTGQLMMLAGATGNVQKMWNVIGNAYLDDDSTRVVVGNNVNMTLANISFDNPLPLSFFSAVTSTSSGSQYSVFSGAAAGSLVYNGTYTDVPGDNDMVVYDHFNYGAYLDRSGHVLENTHINVGTNERMARKNHHYYNLVQNYNYFGRKDLQDGRNLYSFGTKPLAYQPSGTFNFSRVDNLKLSGQVNTNYEGESYDFIRSGEGVNLILIQCAINIFRIAGGLGSSIYQN